MQRILQTMALLGAFLVLCVGLWQGWSLYVTFKKMAVAYMAIFILGALAVLALQAAGHEPGDGMEKSPHVGKKAS